MRTRALSLIAVVAFTCLGFAACGGSPAVQTAVVLPKDVYKLPPSATTHNRTASLAAYSLSGAASTTVYLTIVTPAQTGKDNYPAYIPSDVTIPAHSKVTFVITNFDDATPLMSPLLANVTGTVANSMSVTPIDPSDPNAPGEATTVSKVNPQDIGHTFTASTLGNLNIPVPGHSRVSFTVETGAPGTFDWNCFDPCGTGADGTSGPMITPGYMRGTITVV
jgi:hypothetical protein